MNVAIYARVSTHDKDQNPETQLRPLWQQLARLMLISPETRVRVEVAR
jgi:DNA invertase Pin-like site-specific DNA recombinase